MRNEPGYSSCTRYITLAILILAIESLQPRMSKSPPPSDGSDRRWSRWVQCVGYKKEKQSGMKEDETRQNEAHAPPMLEWEFVFSFLRQAVHAVAMPHPSPYHPNLARRSRTVMSGVPLLLPILFFFLSLLAQWPDLKGSSTDTRRESKNVC